MRKILMVILVLVITLAMVIGSASTVSAKKGVSADILAVGNGWMDVAISWNGVPAKSYGIQITDFWIDGIFGTADDWQMYNTVDIFLKITRHYKVRSVRLYSSDFSASHTYRFDLRVYTSWEPNIQYQSDYATIN